MNQHKLMSLIFGALALLATHASAVEYVMVMRGSPTFTLAPTDVAKIVGRSGGYVITAVPAVRSGDEFTPTSISMENGIGNIITGVTSIHVSTSAAGFYVLFEITSPNGFNAVQPTSVLVIPENATGNYDIVVETSDDTATWTPFHSQTVLATDPKRFFRTRIVRRN